MKIVLALILIIKISFAIEYYAKVEPLNSYTVKSSVSGKVLFINEKIEGKKANNSTVVKIDSAVNKVELIQTQNKLHSLKSMIDLEDKNYVRLTKVTSRSGFEKDNQKIKVLNLQSQKSDLLIKIAMLKDSISNKNLIENNHYIYNIAVKEGDYVTPGTLLYEKKDLSKGKVEIFVPIMEANSIKDKTLYIDNEKTDLKINKIYKVADDKHISSYKCEIIIPNIKIFSRLVKIEFK